MNSSFFHTMNDTTSRAFQKALENFMAKLSKEQLKEFQDFGSIQHVYICTKELQDKHKQNRTERYLARLNPYLDGLQQYAKVIDVLVQIRPEIMAIIWGCTRFVLQAASAHLAFFEKLVEALEQIGENLLRYQRLENIFCNNPRVQRVTVLMYEDILSFHWETLNFLRKKAFKQVIHTVLQSFEQKFGTIIGRLDRHKLLLDNEAIAAHIEAASEDRRRHLAMEEEQKREHQNSQRQQLQAWLKPVDYESEMAFVHKELDKLPWEECESTQNCWLMKLPTVKSWMGLENDKKPLIWLTGIPGAGKTFLTYRLFQKLKQAQNVTGDCVCFAFLRSEQPVQRTYDAVLRTFIFQLLQHSPCLISYIFQEYTSKNFQGLSPPTKRIELCQILEVCLEYMPGSTYVILDGLDEAEKDDRKAILKTILALYATSKELRVFISSRRETDIEAQLLDFSRQLEHISIANQNANEIAAYVEACGRDLYEEFSHDETTRDEVASVLTRICNKACGMFLWARLVLHDLARCTNLEGLQEAVENLPKGLEEAYQRILHRIEKNQDAALGQDATRILQMVICSKRPLRLREVKHALAIRIGDDSIEEKRLLCKKIEALCGPILTVEEEGVCFVHFSAREYLTSYMSGPFVELSACHDLLANCSMSYLLFHCFDPELSDEEIDKYIKNGQYMLLNYVLQHWVFHVQEATQEKSLDDDTLLLDQLNILFKKFGPTEYEPQSPSPDVASQLSQESNLPWLCTKQPHLYHWLRKVYSYTTRVDWQAHISGNHPLSIQGNLERIRERFSVAVHVSSPIDLLQLQTLYGPNVFQCTYSLCPYYWDGFPTKDELNIHLQSHMRPFRCEDQTCYWSTAGFSTVSELSQHNTRFHAAFEGFSQMPKGNMISKNVRIPGRHKVLIDAIIQGNVELVRELLSSPNSNLDLRKVVEGKTAVEHAIEQKDREITLMLYIRGGRPRDLRKFLIDAITQGNVGLLKILLSRYSLDWLHLNSLTASKTALEYAVEREDWEMVSMLVNRGGQMHDQHRYLIDAIIQGRTELVRGLLSHINSTALRLNQVVEGKTALDHAVEQEDEKMVLMLIEHGAQNSPHRILIDAIIGDNVELVKTFLSQVNSKLILNTVFAEKTALEHAVDRKNGEMMLMLVENGAKGVRGDGERKAKPFCDALWSEEVYYRSPGQVLAECGDCDTRRQYLEAMFRVCEDSSPWLLALSVMDSESELQHFLANDTFTRTLNLISNPYSLRHYTELQLKCTPLAYAIARGPRHCGIIELLVQAGAEPWTEPLQSGFEFRVQAKFIHRFLNDRITGMQVRMIMIVLGEAPLEYPSVHMLHFSRHQGSALVSEYRTDKFDWLRAMDFMTCTDGSSLLQLGIDYFATERVNMALHANTPLDASIPSSFAGFLVELARSIPENLKGVIRPPFWITHRKDVHSEVSDVIKRCGGSKGPIGYSADHCKVIHSILSELPFVKLPTTIHRILDEAEFWTVQTFTWSYQKPAESFSRLMHAEHYVAKIRMRGGHARHIRFDIAVQEEVTTAHPDAYTTTQVPSQWSIELIRTHSQVDNKRIDFQILCRNYDSCINSVCDNGSFSRQNTALAPRTLVAYSSIDWNYRDPIKARSDWVNRLQDNQWLGFSVSSSDGSAILKDVQIQGKIYYTYN
ncbi:hypothetical protein BDZ91DRAFT_220674 [Kalaharituber pfeilii]|nr:hypothetical protein BDZ91DRAFT_220674 [Kalaharituber pfeilii]